MKRALKIGLGVLGVLLLAGGGAAATIHLRGIPRYPTEAVELRVEVTPERVRRGKKMASMLCAGCHLDPTTQVLTGKRMADAPPEFGVIYSKNITRHPDKGIGGWSDGELAYLLRTGIRRDGQYIPPYMPKLAHISDEDLLDIIAFLRSDDPWVRAAAVDDRESEVTFLTKLLSTVAFKPLPYPKQKITAPPIGDKVAYGRYLVTGALDCYPCHSADFKRMNVEEPEKSAGFLGGGNLLLDVNGKPIYSANLTFDEETGIGRWSEADFRRAIKEGIRPDNTVIGYPMMPLRELSDEEVDAMYAYLRTVPKIRNARPRAAAYATADLTGGKATYYKYSCQSCHGENGVGACDLRQAAMRYPQDDQLKAFIKHPSKVVPESKMPTWDGVIPDAELDGLIQYVRTLAKGS